MSIHINLAPFYNIALVDRDYTESEKKEIIWLLGELDMHYDMCDEREGITRCGAWNRKVINRLNELGFISCNYKMFGSNEFLIDSSYCEKYEEYATGKVRMKGIRILLPCEDWIPG